MRPVWGLWKGIFAKLNLLFGELLYKNSRLEGRECGSVQRRWFILLYTSVFDYWNMIFSDMTCLAGIRCITLSYEYITTVSSRNAFSCNMRFSASLSPASNLSINSFTSLSDIMLHFIVNNFWCYGCVHCLSSLCYECAWCATIVIYHPQIHFVGKAVKQIFQSSYITSSDNILRYVMPTFANSLCYAILLLIPVIRAKRI